MARFDWVRFDPDGQGGGGNGALVDEFEGTTLGAAWERIRGDQGSVVSGGTLQIPAQPGDIYQTKNDAKNLVVRTAPSGAWEAVAKLNFEGTAQYHQAGIMIYGNDDNFTKFGRIAHSGAGDEKFEFINEINAVARNEAADSTANIAADFPDDFWVRLTSDGTNVVGHYSTNGSTWTAVGRPAALPADAKIGLFAFYNEGVGIPVAAFDSFTLTGDRRRWRRGRRRYAGRPELRRRVRQRHARQDALERDRPRHARASTTVGGELTSPSAWATSTRPTRTRHRTTSFSRPPRTRVRTG